MIAHAAPGAVDASCSHKWVHQILTDRGMRIASAGEIQGAIEAASHADRAKLRDYMIDIQAAVESPGQVAWIRRLLTGKQEGQSTPARERGVRPASQENPPLEPDRHRRVVRIYGAKAALTIELDTLKKKALDGTQIYTVALEGALARGEREYDWEHKIPFQLTQRELPRLAAMLLGFTRAELVLDNHGPESDKKLTVQDQGGKLYVRLSQGTRNIPLPVTPEDVHAWTGIALEALALNNPHLGDAAQLAMLRRMAQMIDG